ncbi:YppG family protein [Bacillus sp. HMF5848]|uniref:YppG family protein n=1 Tax=Bacillus sp. HMF5848 TaxID=2495421 RepID=UPI00163B1804|nr:YppG family protein [Bacillus sp. HMF5848]
MQRQYPYYVRQHRTFRRYPIYGYRPPYQMPPQYPYGFSQQMPPIPQFPNQYPAPNKMPFNFQGNQAPSIMNQFKKNDGSWDFDKMFNTAGQFMSAMNQVNGVVKGFSGIFKV